LTFCAVISPVTDLIQETSHLQFCEDSLFLSLAASVISFNIHPNKFQVFLAQVCDCAAK